MKIIFKTLWRFNHILTVLFKHSSCVQSQNNVSLAVLHI